MEPKIKKAAEAAYVAEPNKHKDVATFLESMVVGAERQDQYEEAATTGKRADRQRLREQGDLLCGRTSQLAALGEMGRC